MNHVILSALVLDDALRKLRASLYEVRRQSQGGRLYLHLAPPRQIADTMQLCRLQGLVIGALARFGKSDHLTFREIFGVLYLGRIAWLHTSIDMYPAVWLAEQMCAANPCPQEPLCISQADLLPQVQ